MRDRLLFLALLAPALPSADGPPLPREALDSPFGIVCPWPEVGRSGMGAVWCRCGAGATEMANWPGNEPAPGVFRWEGPDAEWHRYVEQGLVPTPILGYTAGWASRAPDGSRESRQAPANLWDYYRFCRAISERFAGRVWFWEVWNEPNIGFFEGTICDYADLVKTAALGLRAGSPEAYVVFGGMAGVDRPFLERCYAHGVREYYDVMAAHPYQWGKTFDDGWFISKLRTLHEILKAHGDESKPVWLNELGWSTGDANISEVDQARLLVQAYVTAIAQRDLGIERVFWFCVKDWGGPGYGVYADNGAKKPAWHAYRTMVQQLEGLKAWGRLPLGDGLRAYAFADEDRTRCVLVVWATGLESRDTDLPEGLRASAANDLMGADLPLPRAAEGRPRLRATPEPIYLWVAAAPIAGLVEPVRPLPISLPDRGRRPSAWLSLYPQPGCSLPWLRRGGETTLRGRLFNAGTRPLSGRAEVETVDPGTGTVLSRARAPVSAEPQTDTTFSVTLQCPADAPSELLLRLRGHRLDGLPDPAAELRTLVAEDACINFLANSYLERSWYLQPDDKSGCSESLRFGSEWVYRLPVPVRGEARVRMWVGAHAAGPWSVAWSGDGREWTELLAGQSDLDWHEGIVPDLSGAYLYLRCRGSDQQLGEVVVLYRATASAVP